MSVHDWDLWEGMSIGLPMIGNGLLLVMRQKSIDSTLTEGHGVGLVMEQAYNHTNSLHCEAWWWLTYDLGCMTFFRPGFTYKIEGRMDQHLY